MMFKRLLVLLLAAASCVAAFAKATKQPDTYAYTRAVEAYNAENYTEAREWFEREIAEHPDNGYAYVYLSTIQYAANEYGKALTSIDKAIKALPKNDKMWRASAYGSRAEVNLALLDTIKALDDLAQAIKINPDEARSFHSRGQIYYEMKNYDLSDADYRHNVELDPGDVTGYMGQGRNARDRGRWADAVAFFDRAVRLDPEFSQAYAFRAEVYIKQNLWAQATDDIVKALDIDGNEKARDHMLQLPDEARGMMKSKLKIHMAKQPTNNYWPFILGWLAKENEEYGEAIPYFEKAHSIDANSICLEMIARCYLSMNDCVPAADYTERAMAMNPDDYDLIDLKADILSRTGRLDEALEYRDKYVAKYPDSPYAYLYRADDYMKARRFDDAVSDFNTMLVISPELADFKHLLLKRADANRLTGNTEAATKDYQALLETERDSTLNVNSYTPFAYTGLGRNDEAVAAIKVILENDTLNKAGTYYNAACIYARAGLIDEAIANLRKGVEEPGALEVVERDYDLDILRDMPEFKEIVDKLKADANKGVTELLIVEDNPDYAEETVEVPFTKESGVTKVKCSINGLPLHFVFDTGAADVTLSMVEANFMMKNDFIKPTDIIGSASYMDANGDITEGTVVNLRKVDFGGLELENVRASVVRNQKAPLLLGQSVLGRLGKIEIDNPGLRLIITHKVKR